METYIHTLNCIKSVYIQVQFVKTQHCCLRFSFRAMKLHTAMNSITEIGS